MSWARPATHALHGAPGRAGTGTPIAVSCRPWAVPKGHVVGRAVGPWAAWPYIRGSDFGIAGVGSNAGRQDDEVKLDSRTKNIFTI